MKISINGVPTKLTEEEIFLFIGILGSTSTKETEIKHLEKMEPHIRKEVWFFLYDLIFNRDKFAEILSAFQSERTYLKEGEKCTD